MNNRTLDNNEGAPARVFQWKYTSCPYNVEKINGFATFSKSSELSDADVEDLREALGRYVAPESAPLRPTDEDLRDRTKFPVAFSSLKLKSGRSVIARTSAVGKAYGGARYGNFFVHALILEKGEPFDALRYFDSTTFASGLTEEEINLGKTPEPLPTLDLQEVVPNRLVFKTRFADSPDPNVARFRRELVDGVLKSLRDGKRTVVVGNFDAAQRLIALTLASLPSPIASRIEFTTWTGSPLDEARPNEINDVVLMFTTREKLPTLTRRNNAWIVKLDAPLESRYAEALSDEFLTLVKQFDFSFTKNLPKRKLFDVLEDVATLFSVLRGRIEPENVDGCQTFLTTQSASVCANLAPDFCAASEDARDSFWNGWQELPRQKRLALYHSFLRLNPDEAKIVGKNIFELTDKVRAELWDFLRQFVESIDNEVVASLDEIDVEKLVSFWRYFNYGATLHFEFLDFLSQAPQNVVERFYTRIFDYESFTSPEVKTLLVDSVGLLKDASGSAVRTSKFQEKIAAFWLRNLHDDDPKLLRRELLLNDFADVFGFGADSHNSQARTFLKIFQKCKDSTKLNRFVQTLNLYVEIFDGKSWKDAFSTFDTYLSLLEDVRRFIFGRLQSEADN